MGMEGCKFEYTSAKQTDETAGKTKKDYRWDENGKLKNVLSVNEDGQVVSRTKYKKDGTIAYEVNYKYNDKGQCIDEEFTFNDGTKSINKYQYDKEGQVSRLEIKQADGVNYDIEYLYDEEGNIVQQTITGNKRPIILNTFVYDYNKDRTAISAELDCSGNVVNSEKVNKQPPSDLTPNVYGYDYEDKY